MVSSLLCVVGDYAYADNLFMYCLNAVMTHWLKSVSMSRHYIYDRCKYSIGLMVIIIMKYPEVADW